MFLDPRVRTVLEQTQLLLGQLQLDDFLRKSLKNLIELTEAERGYFLLERKAKIWVLADGIASPDILVRTKGRALESLADISAAAVEETLRSRELLCIERLGLDPRFSTPHLEQTKSRAHVMIIPLIFNGESQGLYYLERERMVWELDEQQILVELVAPQLAVAVQNALQFGELKRRHEEARQKIEEANSGGSSIEAEYTYEEAVSRAKRASYIVHKLGNMVNVALMIGEELQDVARDSKVTQLVRANAMLESVTDLVAYFTQDAKGKLLPDFYQKVGMKLQQEHASLIEDVDRLVEQLQEMRELLLAD